MVLQTAFGYSNVSINSRLLLLITTHFKKNFIGLNFFQQKFKGGFYSIRENRKLDPENIDHYIKFPNQTRDPRVVVYEDGEMLFATEDTQPEFYDPGNRDNVEFDKFEGF